MSTGLYRSFGMIKGGRKFERNNRESERGGEREEGEGGRKND